MLFKIMLKSQQDSTDIYSDEQDKNQIILKIDSADHNWNAFFLKNDSSDFKIIHRNISYPLHRFIVFKNMNLHVLDNTTHQSSMIAPHSFKPEILTGIISCLYAFQLKLCRSEVLQALSVIHFLKIAKLKKIIEQDISLNLQEYQLFPVLQKSIEMGMEEIKEQCLAQLQMQDYEQMKYAKYELLTCNEETFKMVIHYHNQRRWEDPAFGQTDKFIQELINQYCKHNGYTQRKKSQLLKAFNQMALQTHVPAFTLNTVSPTNLKQSNQINIRLYTPRVLPTQSMAVPNVNFFRSIKSSDDSSKSMINLTFMSNHKRKKSNRASENNSSHSKLCTQLIAFKDTTKKNENDIDELKETLDKIQKKLSTKQTQAHNNKFRLSQIQKLLAECENEIMEDSRKVQHLQLRCNKVAFRRLRQCESFCSDMTEQDRSDDSDDDDKEEQKEYEKKDNPKDQKLRVSLIQSKWVCC